MTNTKAIRVTSMHTRYDCGRVIVIEDKAADEWVAKGDAEYVWEKDIPKPKPKPKPKAAAKPKRGRGRPPKVIEVAAVEPPETPEGGVLRNFRGKRKE